MFPGYAGNSIKPEKETFKLKKEFSDIIVIFEYSAQVAKIN